MPSKKSGSYIIGILIVFVLVLFAGRYFYSANDNTNKLGPPTYSDYGQDSTVKTAANNTNDAQSINSNADSVDPEAELTACATSLQSDAEFKRVQYYKGTILVTFKAGVSFTDAKNALATYDIKIQEDADTQASYPARRLVTGIVPEGQEFTKICIVKNNAQVQYAGLNPSFALHQ